MARLLAGLSAVLVLAAGGTLAARPAAGADDGSLEAFVKRLRAEREAEHARLRPLVEELVKKLGQARSGNELKKLAADFAALGGEAAPLLVPFLDPGAEATPEQEQQASQVAELLARARAPALLEDLVRLAHSASPRGRALAMRVLGESPEGARARAALQELYPEVAGGLRAECVRALARLAPEDPLIVTALGDTHPDVLAAALRALQDEPRKQPRAEVVALLGDENRGASALSELVDYLCVPGQKLEEDVAAALLRFACRADLPVEARMKVLDGLPRVGLSLTSRLRKEVEPLVTSSDSAIKDSVLVLLTRLGDGKARRELLRFYDQQVDDNESWPLAYQRRGEIELRIGEYRDAARDFREALRLHGSSARMAGNRELWVNLARAYVKDNKLKSAAEALEEFTLSTELKRTLKADPDFLPLAEHSRYRSLFE